MEQKMNEGRVLGRERQRKFLLFLPIVIVPFMTLLLWSAGIVGSATAQTAKSTKQPGFNFHLPAATQAKDSNWNKMQYYAQADKDSAKLHSLMQSYGGDSGSNLSDTSSAGKTGVSGIAVNTDPKEKLIEEKIAALNKKLNGAVATNPENSSYENEMPDPPPAQKKAALQRMQELQQWASQPTLPEDRTDTQQSDPELEKLDGMLNKVLDIQHPERMQQQLQQQSEQNKKQVFPVSIKKDATNVSLLEGMPDNSEADTIIDSKQAAIKANNHFFSLESSNKENAGIENTIAAEIPEEQVLVNGATVKLRLLDDVYIRGVLVPKGRPLFGVANLKGERLEININSIGYNGQLLPVSLSVYDMDGQEGVYIPGAITRNAAKQSAGQGVETMNFGTLDASLGAQAASAGIQAAKQLIGKKIKLVKVTVRAGYRVMLRDMNDKAN